MADAFCQKGRIAKSNEGKTTTMTKIRGLIGGAVLAVLLAGNRSRPTGGHGRRHRQRQQLEQLDRDRRQLQYPQHGQRDQSSQFDDQQPERLQPDGERECPADRGKQRLAQLRQLQLAHLQRELARLCADVDSAQRAGVAPPGLSAAGLESCNNSVSAGGSSPAGSLAIGFPIQDGPCNKRLNARTMWSFGLHEAAIQQLCLDGRNGPRRSPRSASNA